MEEKYELCNLTDLTFELKKPLHGTRRINYTCYDVSKNYIVCGATSGSLYLFRRFPISLIQLIPNLNGPIVHVAISPYEHYIGFTTQRGAINVYIIDFTTLQPVISSYYIHEMNITQIKWKQNENQLYFGDMKGNVFLVNLNNFLGRSSINISVHPILFLESPIVQICEFEQLLLVSNFTKCILCNTLTEEFKQIGNQPRDGKFGACFFSNEKSITTRVICARPGSRIWECSIEGNVMKTHKFKNALEKEQATNIDDTQFDEEQQQQHRNRLDSMKHEISEQFMHLQIINKFFILGHTTNAFYIFDLIHSNIVLWNNDFGSINTLKVINDDTILIFTNDNKAFSIQLKRLDDIFFDKIIQKQYEDAIQLLQKHINYFKNKLYNVKFRKYLSVLRDKLHDTDSEKPLEHFFYGFDEMFLELSENEECELSNDVFTSKNSNSLHPRTIESLAEKENQDKFNQSELCSSDNLSDELYHSNEKIDTPNDQIQFELKTFAEEQKVLQNLFFIYKSLKISKFKTMPNSYAEFFDKYDLHGIRRLLNALQDMILESDCDVTEFEAKKTCAYIYLNYVKENCLFSHESESFITDCLLLVNSQDNLTNHTQRCQHCNFPLTASGTMKQLKYTEKMELIVKRQVSKKEKLDSLYKIIDHIPAAMVLLLKVIAAQHGNKSISDIEITDLFFACFHHQSECVLDSSVQSSELFHSYDFWKSIFQSINRLHHDMMIKCIRCCEFSKVSCIDPQFSYDNVFNQCLYFLPSVTALTLLNELANMIPSDAISRKFYVKCLLNVS